MVKFEKDLKIIETEVLVVGGGPAGFAAAVSCARNGCKTLVIESKAVFGGMSTSGLVGPFMTCFDDEPTEQIVKGIFEELVQRTEKKGGAIHPSKVEGGTTYSSYLTKSHWHVTPFQSEIIALTMDEMIVESGADTLFETNFLDVIMNGEVIEYVIISNKNGIQAVKAEVVIDCTGDGDVAERAGCPTWKGTNGDVQPTTLFFEITDVDVPMFKAALDERKDDLGKSFKNSFYWLIEEARKNGDWEIEREELGAYEQNIPGRFKINTTRMTGIDATNPYDVTRAMMDGRRQVQEVFNFMKKYVPGCKNIQLVQQASTLGIRETRHVEGEYILEAKDLLNRTIFEDAIATYAYALDVHNSTGSSGTFTQVDGYYTIPYRALLPKNTTNLLVAGRPISGTSEAAASYRVMPACFATGQAAGTAASLAVKHNGTIRNVDINELKQTLLQQDVVIKNN